MPITRRQLELEISPSTSRWIGKAQSFLKERASEAYTEEEISLALGCGTEARERTALSKPLEILTDFQSLDKRQVYGKTYYAYLGDPVEPLS